MLINAYFQAKSHLGFHFQVCMQRRCFHFPNRKDKQITKTEKPDLLWKKKPARCFVCRDLFMLRIGGDLLRFHVASDWSRNNKHSKNFLWCSRSYRKDCKWKTDRQNALTVKPNLLELKFVGFTQLKFQFKKGNTKIEKLDILRNWNL